MSVEPHPHYGAVENQPHDRLFRQRAGIPSLPIALHLAPNPAHRVLADRAAKQSTQRPTHPARIGAGKIAAGDQRVGRHRTALIGPQRLAFPLRCLAVRRIQPGARHLDLQLAECSQQRPRPVAVTMAGHAHHSLRSVGRSLGPTGIARAIEHLVELAFEHRLQEFAGSIP